MLLEHQLIYFMNRTVLPFGFAVFVMGRWDPRDLSVKENEQLCVVDLGWAKTNPWLHSVFSAARCPLSSLSMAYQPGALVNFHAEGAFETQASFMLWEDLRGVNPA